MTGKRQCGVSVVVRVRPRRVDFREVEDAWDIRDAILYERAGCDMRFPFDNVIPPGAGTVELYEQCISGPIIQSVMAGFNATVFAYGQTGSGKSYTMLGEGESPGVVPLAVDEVFSIISDQQGQRDYNVSCSMMEIYNEELRDLLADPSGPLKPLRIQESPLRGVYVYGLVRRPVTSRQQFMDYIRLEAEMRRVTAGTQMNERSSRSHCIVRLDVAQLERVEAPGDQSVDISASPSSLDCSNDSDYGTGSGMGAAGDSIKMSALHLVDLAGSERISKTGATGGRAKEGANINKSLLFLGTVIEKLSDPQRKGYIPYRDSKLTRILQTALGGNSVTTVIAAVTLAEQHREETRSTLIFASRAVLIKNVVHQNEMGDDKTRIRKLEAEVKELRRQLAIAQLMSVGQRLRLRHLSLDGATKGEFEQLKAMTAQLQAANEKLRKELSVKGGDTAQIPALEMEIAQLRATVGELQQERTEAEQECQQLQEEQETLESLCKELEEDNDAKGDKIDRIRRERKELETTVESLRGEVAERDRRLVAMQQERAALISKHEADVQRARSQNDDGLRGEMAITRNELLDLKQKHSALLDMFAKAEAKHRQGEAQQEDIRRDNTKTLDSLRVQLTEQARFCRRFIHIAELVRKHPAGGDGDEPPAPPDEAMAEGPVKERDVEPAVRLLQGFISARNARPPAICVPEAPGAQEQPEEGGVRVRVRGFGSSESKIRPQGGESHADPMPKVRVKGMPTSDGGSQADGESVGVGVRVKGIPMQTQSASTQASCSSADAAAAGAAAVQAAYERIRNLEETIALRDSQRDVIIDTKLKRMQDLVVRLHNTGLNLQSAVVKLAEENRQLKDVINIWKQTTKLPKSLRAPTPTGEELIRAAQERPVRDHHLWH
eukprot:Hpha_TRINITY_DN15373_c1_g2::TRINITY_DN15373_c1_g2_i2::g.87610::m.87610/K11498/CENPE; centromeric protein E